ncbi:hypothetical protein D3C72_1773930 [compost metagenome]
MTIGIVEPLEVIQIAQQQGDGFAPATALGQQLLATRQERAAITDTGQRVGIGCSLELQLGALTDHGQGDVGDADRVEHGFEQQEGEKPGTATRAGQRVLQGDSVVGDHPHRIEPTVHHQ